MVQNYGCMAQGCYSRGAMFLMSEVPLYLCGSMKRVLQQCAKQHLVKCIAFGALGFGLGFRVLGWGLGIPRLGRWG
jgi:hypothetical protein